MNKNYPCRTERVSGTYYSVKFYNVSTGKLSMTCSQYESREQAEKSSDRIIKACPHLRYEVVEHNWQSDVCIECGKDEYGY